MVKVSITADGCSAGNYKPNPAGGAVTKIFQYGFTGTNNATANSTSSNFFDSWLDQSSGNITKNYGTSKTLEVGKTTNQRRSIFYFNISEIPSNAIVQSAVFSAYRQGGDNGANLTISAYSLTNNWVENQVSWNNKSTGNPWTNPGGDYGSLRATSTIPAIKAFYNWNLEASGVQSWLTNAAFNNGILLRQNGTTLDKRHQFTSKENTTTPLNRPKLTITYLIPEPCTTIPNRAPLANPNMATVMNGQSVVISPLSNDGDVDPGNTLTINGVSSISAGSATFTNSTVTYTANINSTVPRTERLTYTISDGNGGLDSAYIYITVTNAPSTANRDNASTNSNTLVSIPVTTNDLDPEGGTISAPTITLRPRNGIAVVNGNNINYTPANGFTGKDTLIYSICETLSGSCSPDPLCDTALVVITVNNQTPTANNNSKTVLPCLSNTIELINNDTDPENGVLTVSNLSSLSNPAAGSLVNNQDGTVTFTPATGYNGTVTFTYTVTDNGVTPLTSAPATVSITVNSPVNSAPVANDDQETFYMDQTDYFAVVDNDTDPENNNLTVPTITVQPLHGSATVLANGLIKYIPNRGYYGKDTLSYQICDIVSNAANCSSTQEKCDTAKLYYNILSINTVTAVNDENSTWINTPVGGSVLNNDFDPEGDNPIQFNGFIKGGISYPTGSITVSGVNASGNPVANAGTLLINPNGTYTFTPANNFIGYIDVPYSIQDNNSNNAYDTAYLHITVNPLPNVTNSVIANNDEYTTPLNVNVNGNVLTSNDFDPQRDVFSLTSFTFDSNGNGTQDSTGTIGTATTIGGITSTGLPVSNAGTLVLNANGSFTFNPQDDFTGSVEVVYTITDANGAVSTAILHIDIAADANGPLNDPPIAGDDFTYTNINTPIRGNFAANDSDPNGNPISYGGTTINPAGPALPIGTPVTTEQGGTIQFFSNGTYLYTPPLNYSGPDKVNYQICDVTVVSPQPLCGNAIIHLLVGPSNTTNAINDENSTWQDVNVSGSVLTNDYDAEGNTQTFGSFLNQTNNASITSGAIVSGLNASGSPVVDAGTLTFDASGNYTFDPNPAFTGTVSIPYTVCDNGVTPKCDTAYLTITVSPLPSVANSVIANNDENISYGSPVSSNLLLNDVDPQGNSFTVTAIAGGTVGTGFTVAGVDQNGNPVANAGTLIVNANGSYTFTPASGFVGSINVPYTITDNNASPATSTAILHIDVLADQNGPLNDPPFAGDDFINTPKNTPVNGNFIGNDSDPNGNSLSLNGTTIVPGGPHTPIGTPVTTQQGGTVQFYADGTYTYTPPSGYTGPDFCNYTICDVTVVNPNPLCNQAMIHFLVAPANTTNAINDENSTWQDVNVSGSVLTNDYDAEGNTQTFGSFLNQTNNASITSGAIVSGLNASGSPVVDAGTLTFDASGNYTFDPNPAFTGTVSIPYTVCDNGVTPKCDTAYLTITVSPLPSVANSVIANNDENISYGSPVSSNLLLNDVDPQGNSFTVTAIAGGTVGTGFTVAGVDQNGNPVANAGTLIVNANGSYTFTPASGFVGSINVPYTITDNNASPATSTAILHIDVLADQNGPLNDPPFAGDDFINTPKNTPVNGNFIGNDSDPNGNSLSLNGTTIVPGGPHTPIGTPVTTQQGGTVQFYADGTYTYTPPSGYTGPDFCNYTICDVTVVNPNPLCNQAMIHFLVAPVPPVPVTLTTFNAVLISKNQSKLFWISQSEINLHHYEIERSTDGLRFINRGLVNAKGSVTTTQNYNFIDELNTNNAVVFYRLKIVDNDGQYKYSNIVSLKLQNNGSVDQIKVYPNPFVSNINIEFTSLQNESAVIRIINSDGKTVYKEQTQFTTGLNMITIPNMDKYSKSTYLVEVITNSNRIIRKIIKN